MKSATIKRSKYPLDSSASIHLASLRKEYSNTFRFTATLNEPVNPDNLQVALDNITPRFPTMVAGIRSGFFNYYITPAKTAPRILEDVSCLSTMSRRAIRECGLQVYYKDNEISIETFHALTDGDGAIIFMGSLLAEYLSLNNSVEIEYNHRILNPNDDIQDYEFEDAYKKHSGKTKSETNKQTAYQLPCDESEDSSCHIITKTYKTEELLAAARRYGVSLTTFLTTIMAESIMQVQNKYSVKKKPIRILVPVNLRKKFESRTLSNFSLFALPFVKADDKIWDFKELLHHFADQIKNQLSAEHLQNTFTMNTKSMNLWAFRIQPLKFKQAILSFVYHRYGERNSCLSISNLGEITFPESMAPYVKSLGCALTPRRNAPYNCGIISYAGYLRINISRRGKGCGLEEIFYKTLERFLNPSYA
ncbi:MAG: hypothetical protein IJW18_08935 [Lachnospiraceae bacterium]|nr:hypothetical protein [Lachnospiraceae bacterium]